MHSTGQTDAGGELAVGLPEALLSDALVGSARTRDRVLPSSATRPRLWLDALAIAWLALIYDIVNNFAPLRLHTALGHAQGLLDLERALHLDPELALNRWLAARPTLGAILSNYYDNAHFVVTFGLLGWLWYKRADIYRPLRNSLVLMNVLGLAVFWLYPVAPPRMLGGFSDVVADTGALGSWHTGALAHAANQLAAMPSLHMAWAAWCSLVIWRLSGKLWARVAAVLYPCLTCVAVLATGNHFVLDIFAGLLTAALAVALVAPLAVAGSACYKLVTKSRIG